MIDKREGTSLYRRLFSLLLTLFILAAPAGLRAAQEWTFPVLTIGAHSYTNVTITTQSKKYIFLLHSAGMANIKVADLSPDLRETLGYNRVIEEPPKNVADKAAKWAKAQLGTANVSQVQARTLAVESSATKKLKSLSHAQKYELLGLLGAISIVSSAMFRLLCLKAGSQPGFLIWLPILRWISLRRAARMSWTWALLALVPGLGPVLWLAVWCFKIGVARGVNGFVGLAMLLPVIGIFIFLYLVFSDGVAAAEPKPVSRMPQLMTLETA